ncbi:hypothetical protein [Pseudomonas sp. D1HM]|uniref:hypothetical protein n=1 Tax=Pseudomonas sp. D1HM TaxID=1784816 RepID=UPI00211A516D|nr:hypothetical protein [Pseudomonas sp. D1HM]
MTLALNTASLNTLSLQDHALDGEAQRHAIECLLNCYLREYALPRNEANLHDQTHDLPMSLRQGNGRCISIAQRPVGGAYRAHQPPGPLPLQQRALFQRQ